MRKEVLSLRLDPEIIKWVNSKTTKTKNKSEVVQELLYITMQNEKISSESKQVSLQEQAAKASLFTMRMLELFLKMPSEKGVDICKKARAHYKNDLQLLSPGSQATSELQSFELEEAT